MNEYSFLVKSFLLVLSLLTSKSCQQLEDLASAP